ncbi:MAG: flagellar motor switch protein FliM [Kiritimatiellia bacterium]|jgi:flagellar motor switch protein FliM
MLDSPLQVDAEVLGRMQDLFQATVRKVRSSMVNRIGIEVPVRFGEVGFASYQEIQDQFLQEGSSIYVRFDIGEHPCVLAIDTTLLARIMGLLLGEDPWAEPAAYEQRPPTRMDLTIAQRLAVDVFSGLAESLPSDVNVELAMKSVSASPRVDLPLARTALMLDAALDFGPAEDPYGLMTIAMPVTLTTILWPQAKSPPNRPNDRGVSRVLPIPLTVVAELTRINLAYSELEHLKVGQLLELGSMRDVVMSIAGKIVLRGEAGVIDGTRCVRIVKRENTATNEPRG